MNFTFAHHRAEVKTLHFLHTPLQQQGNAGTMQGFVDSLQQEMVLWLGESNQC